MLKLLLKSFILLFFVINLYGQAEQFNFTGNGARAAGMGYAFTGIADDATAISWNSAGLTQLYSMEASIIGRIGLNSVTLKNYGNWNWNYYNIDMASNFQLNFISFVVPFEIGDRNVVAGIAYRNQYDFNSDIKQKFADNFNTYKKNDVTKGGISTISPSASVEINEMLSVGTVVNIIVGSQDSKGIDEFNNTSYDYVLDFSGVSFDIGALLRPSDLFTIGANFNLPYTLKIKQEGIKSELDIPFFFSLGTGIHITDNFLLGFDYHSRNWSNAGDYNGEKFSELDLNSFHVGIEYLLQSGNAIIPLRGGFYTNPTFQTDYQNKQISTNVFSIGMGLIMEPIIIDIAFEFGGIEKDYGDNVIWQQTNNRLTLGATIHFGN